MAARVYDINTAPGFRVLEIAAKAHPAVSGVAVGAKFKEPGTYSVSVTLKWWARLWAKLRPEFRFDVHFAVFAAIDQAIRPHLSVTVEVR